MFPLHDHTRRTLCRAIFLALCALPTFSVLAWGISYHLPSHVSAVCREVQSWTGYRVQVAQVTHPRPGVMMLHGLVLSNTATGNEILRAKALMIDAQGSQIRIKAIDPSVSADGLARLWETLRWQIGHWDRGRQVDFGASSLDLLLSRGEYPLQDVFARIDSAESGPQFRLQFLHSNNENGDPTEIHVLCDLENKSIRYDLATGAAALPCVIADALFPTLKSLGPEAMFKGHLSATHSPAGWDGGLVGPGRIADFQLESLARDYAGRQLTGTARLDLELLTFSKGKITSAFGEVHAGPGRIDPMLIHSLGQFLGVRHVATPPGEFGELALSFFIDPNGIVLRDRCGSTIPSFLTDRAGNPVAAEPPHRQPIDALVRALTPPSAAAVPATPESERMLGLFALPPGPAPTVSQPVRP